MNYFGLFILGLTSAESFILIKIDYWIKIDICWFSCFKLGFWKLKKKVYFIVVKYSRVKRFKKGDLT